MLTDKERKTIFEAKPFQVRNADEFELFNVIRLFVDPTDGLKNPFEFENTIVKGKMGSGKTMYLRANHAYYLSTIIPNLLANDGIVLPVYLKLSDFQNLSNSGEIYYKIVLRIIQEIGNARDNFFDSQRLFALHTGMLNLPANMFHSSVDYKSYYERLGVLTADEYVEKTKSLISGESEACTKFFKLSAEYSRQKEVELHRRAFPEVQDIVDAYEWLLKPFGGKLLILVDEVSSLNKSFFHGEEGTSKFETLMNQLRTLNFVRTKIAIYPQDYADILPETRYGDTIYLQENIKDDKGYDNYLNRTVSLIEQYAHEATDIACDAEDLFEIETGQVDVLEQLINASDGNTRRLVQLLDLSLNAAYKENGGTARVTLSNAMEAIDMQARNLEQQFSQTDIEFLRTIATTCRARTTFMFRFPNKSIDLQRFTQKSAEYNIINLIEAGAGRKGAVYAIDYAYSVYKEVPTHYLTDTERIDKDRCRKTGQWITKITTINDNVIENAQIPGKIEGEVIWLDVNGDISGAIQGDNGKRYFFLSPEEIIEEDRKKHLRKGLRVRFLPCSIDGTGKARLATNIEILS